MKKAIRRLTYAILGLFGLQSLPAMAAIDTFLCFPEDPEIQGETQDKRAKDCVELLDWSWGAENTTNVGGTTGGGGAGKTDFETLVITKLVDNASVELEKRLFSGTPIDRMELRVYRACGDEGCNDPVIRIESRLNVITASNVTATGGDDFVTETFEFAMGSIQRCYRRQKLDGTLEAEKCSVWSIVLNQPVPDIQ